MAHNRPVQSVDVVKNSLFQYNYDHCSQMLELLIVCYGKAHYDNDMTI